MLLLRTTQVKYLGEQNNVNLFAQMGGLTNVAITSVFVTTGNISSNVYNQYALDTGNLWQGGCTIVLKIGANNTIKGAKGNSGVNGVGGTGGITGNGSNGGNGHAGHVGGRSLNISTLKEGANRVLVYIINEGVITSGDGGDGGLGGGGGGGSSWRQA